jgi:molybdopterin converting factor small subunit
MHVTVKLFGTLRRLSQTETPGYWIGEIPEHSRIKDLIALLGTSEKEASHAAINKKVCPFDTEISENDEIILVTNMGGG